MYLLYVDESGNPDSADDRHFVFGGIAMFERKPWFVSQAVEEVKNKFFAKDAEVEFHAQSILSHKEEPWHSMQSSKRAEIMESLCDVICQHDITLFGVVLERSSNPDPVIRGFEELCNRFELFLNHLYNEGNQQRGLIIFDSSRHESTLQKLLLEYRRSGTRFGKLKHFSEVPLFTDSKATRNLQLADLIAHALFRRYERSDTRWLDRIISKFDTSSDGSVHGLVHMTTNRHNCPCPACLTRRMAKG